MYKPNEDNSENDIAEAIREEIADRIANETKAADYIDDISKAVESKVVGKVKPADYVSDISRTIEARAAKGVSNTDFTADLTRAVVNSVSTMDTKLGDGAPDNLPLNPADFAPGADTSKPNLTRTVKSDARSEFHRSDTLSKTDSRLPYTEPNNIRRNPPNSNKSTPKPKGLWGKFKKLPIAGKAAVIIGSLAVVALLILGIWLLYGDSPVPEPDEPVITETPPPPPPPTGVQSVNIFSDGLEITSTDILIGDIATLTALVEATAFDYEIIWENSRPDIVEISSTRAGGAEITITGLTQGTSRLTVSVNGIQAVVIVRVGEVPPIHAETVTITHDGTVVRDVELYVGHNMTLQIVVEPYDFDDEIRVSSSNPAVMSAALDEHNENEVTVTGIAAGNAALSVHVGRISVNVGFTVSVELIEVPHPFAVSLEEFFADAQFGTHATIVTGMFGAPGDVVLASKALAAPNFAGSGNDQRAVRFMYLHDGTLRAYDVGGGAFISARDYLASISNEDAGMVTALHLFTAGQLEFNSIALWALEDGRFFRNTDEISRSQYETYLRHYGLDRTVNRPDDTAQILAMTIIVEAS